MPLSAVTFRLVVIFCYVSFVYSQSSTCDPSTPKTVTLRLKKDLLCGYDRQVRPVIHHANQTKVAVLVAPRYIDFDEITGTLKLASWFGMSWLDPHLQWDPTNYEFVSTLNLDSQTIWVPDLSVYNSVNIDMSLDTITAPCFVNMRGKVRTVTQIEHRFHCISDWSNWPYDIHTCEMTVGSRSYIGSTLDIDFAFKKGMYMGYFVPHREWDILNNSMSRLVTHIGTKNETFPLYLVTLNFKFILKRHASVYIASYIVPGIVMMMMSLCIPWMNLSRPERINILCALTILQCLYLQYIGYKIPSNGDRTPRIVCFYRDSLFITGLLFLVTIITRHMTLLTLKPLFLQSVSDFMTNNKVVQLIMFTNSDPKNAAELSDTGDDVATLVIRDQGGLHQWKMLSLLINRLTFLFIFIIYFFLSLYLFP